jgi:nitrogen regulatory protein P-II 1
MKLIVAIIQPHKLTDVKQALFDNKVYLMTVSTVLGSGRQMGYTETYRGVPEEVNLINKVRLEIAVNDDFADPTIDIRIRTMERGEKAIG